MARKKKDVPTYGNKSEVYYCKALKTKGGLTKSDLEKNPRGRIVSKKQRAAGIKRYKENKDKMIPFQKKKNKKSDTEPPNPEPVPKKKKVPKK